MCSRGCLAILFSAAVAEKITFWQIVGWIVAGLVLVSFFVNGLYMLISPRDWFRLPGWFRASGSMRKEKYSSGWGAIQVRVTGLIFAAFVVWIVYDVAFADWLQIKLPPRVTSAWSAYESVVFLTLMGFGVLLTFINGVVMLASPRTWLRLPDWVGAKRGMTKEAHSSGWGAVYVRVLGAAFVAFSIWAARAVFLSR